MKVDISTHSFWLYALQEMLNNMVFDKFLNGYDTIHTKVGQPAYWTEDCLGSWE